MWMFIPRIPTVLKEKTSFKYSSQNSQVVRKLTYFLLILLFSCKPFVRMDKIREDSVSKKT